MNEKETEIHPSLPEAPLPQELPLMGETTLLELDFTEVKTEFEPLPVGQYPAVVSEIERVAESKKSGQPFLKFTFRVTMEEYEGRKLFDNYSLSADALWKLAKTLEALGYPVVGKKIALDYQMLLGAPCQLVVGQGIYQGKIKNEVGDVLPASASDEMGGGPAPF